MPVPANYRWLFTDAVAVTTYRVPLNPNRMTSPYPRRSVETLAHYSGRFRTRKTPTTPFEWTFSGAIKDQDHHDALKLWSEKGNEITITDHLGRVWTVLPQRFNPGERIPSPRIDDRYNYDFTALMLGGPA